MKRIVPIIITLFVFFIVNSCGDPTTKGIVASSQAVRIIKLSVSDILDASKIHLYLKGNPEKTKESNDLFMKGVDAYKNKQLPDSARYYFESSIQKYPSPTAYYELGNVYKQLKAYDKAIQSYKLAEKLDFAPFSNLLYQMAGTFSLKGEHELSGKYLEYALQAGFTDLDRINSDKDLEELRKYFYFSEAIKNGTKGMSNPETLFWLQFKKQFVPASFPLTLNAEISLDELEKLGFISYEFERFVPEMRNSKFSREVGQSYYYAYNLGENQNYTLLIYAEMDHYIGDHNPKTFIAATFDPKGKLIDKKRIHNLDNSISDESYILEANSPLSFVIKLYDVKYEKDTEEEGYWDNPIKEREYVSSYRYKIDDAGKITFSKESKDDLVKK